MNNSEILQSFDIQKVKRDAEIIQAIADQIIKDFAMFGIRINFSGVYTEAYNELFEQVKHHMKWLLEEQHDKLMNLFYQIDINDNLLKRFYSDYGTAPEILADKIIHREMLKVLTRIYFKENPDKLKG